LLTEFCVADLLDRARHRQASIVDKDIQRAKLCQPIRYARLICNVKFDRDYSEILPSP
jgi:hypothetical protein